MHVHHIVRIGDFHALRQCVDSIAAQHLQNLFSPAYQQDLRAKSFAAAIAPITGAWGAWSPPIASRIIFIAAPLFLCFLLLDTLGNHFVNDGKGTVGNCQILLRLFVDPLLQRRNNAEIHIHGLEICDSFITDIQA